MSLAQKPPDPDPGYSRYLAWTLIPIVVYVGVMMFGPGVTLRLTKEREFAENALRGSAVAAEDFWFIHDLKAIPNPARRRRGSGEHAWRVNESGGYFTFDVRGYRSAKDQVLRPSRYRVHFSIVAGTPTVTRIERNPPRLRDGEEPEARVRDDQSRWRRAAGAERSA
jgi:hypothetical protein